MKYAIALVTALTVAACGGGASQSAAPANQPPAPVAVIGPGALPAAESMPGNIDGITELTIPAPATTTTMEAEAPQPTEPRPPCRRFRVLDILFDTGTAALTEVAAASMAELASRLGDAGTIIVVGHADNRPIAMGNQRLSELRAQAVAEALAGAGVAEHRMTVSGRGAEEPLVDADTPAAWEQNRRVEVSVACPAGN